MAILHQRGQRLARRGVEECEARRYRHPGALRLQLQAEVDAVAVVDAFGVVADRPLVATDGEDRRPVEAGPYAKGAVGSIERRDLENPLDRLVPGHAGAQIGNGAAGRRQSIVGGRPIDGATAGASMVGRPGVGRYIDVID